MTNKLQFTTLLLLISFASVNAVLFTPALPAIAQYFAISSNTAQLTITWFLVAYALGQLIYGPLANRYGRKPALYAGITLQIVSSLLCVLSGLLHEFIWLIIGRFFLALGSGVGLKMTFTLVNEYYAAKKASQTIAYLMLAFGITPGLSVALGGFLLTHFSWLSCFYTSAIYGAILLLLTTQLIETKTTRDLNALQLKHLTQHYRMQFFNPMILTGGLLMGICTAFIYIFAAIGPFIAISLFGMSSAQYGAASLLPSLGLVCGSLSAAQLAKHYSFNFIIRLGIFISCAGTLLMLINLLCHLSVLYALFIPMMVLYFGLALIIPNASTLAMNNTHDKSHGSAVMNFLNMGSATFMVLLLTLVPLSKLLLPIVYLLACCILLGAYAGIKYYGAKQPAH